MRVPEAERHLIALDLDGTVLHHGGALDESVADAIRALHEAGHEVVIATGRAVDATLPVIEQLRIRPTWVVCCNGSITLRRDPLAPRSYRQEYVEAFSPREVLTRIRAVLATARFGVEIPDGEFLFSEEIPSTTLPARQRLVSFEELKSVQATRLLVVSPDDTIEDFLRIVDTMGLTRVSYSIGYNTWLDIAPEGVSKESALEVVRQQLGIDRSRVFAAGDGHNDVQMLRWAAHLGDGVAMGQADEAVRAAASRVTGTIEEEGLAVALRDRFGAVVG